MMTQALFCAPLPADDDAPPIPEAEAATPEPAAMDSKAYGAAFRAHPDGIYWLDPVKEDGRLVDFRLRALNPAGALLLRRPEREAVGRPLSALLRTGPDSNWMTSVRAMWKGGGPTAWRLPLSDPNRLLPTRWFVLHGQRSGNSLLIIAREETRLHEAQRDLARAEERLRQTQRLAHVGSWSFDLRRKRAWWSDEAYRICGFEPGGCRPSFLAHWRRVHPEDRRVLGQSIRRALADGATFVHEYRIVRPDGSERVLRANGQVLCEPPGPAREVVGNVQDVTELRASEARTRTSESLRQRVINNAPIILFELDAQGIVRVSEGKGLERQVLDPGQVVGRSIFDLYADSPDFLRNIRRALAGESLVATNETRGGVFERWLEPVRDAEGRITGVIGVAQDVTERHRAESDLTASQALLRTMVDSVPHFIWAKDPEGRFVIANRAMAEFHGLNPEDVVGRTLMDMPGLMPDVVRELSGLDQEVARNLRAVDSSEFQLSDPSGAQRWFRVHKRPLMNGEGELIGLVGIAEEITGQRIIRQELEQSRGLLQAIFDTFPARILVNGPDGGTVLVNRRQAEELGLPPEEAAQAAAPCGVLSEEARRQRREEVAAVLEEGRSFDKERRRQRPDGSEAYERVIRVPLYGSEGAISGVLNIALDMTAQRTTEAQLHQAQKMEAVGQLAGGVAHDFNNLLQIMIGYGELARSRTGDDPQLESAVQQILGAARRAGDLTRKLLAFSRRQVLQPRIVDLNALVEEMMRMLGRVLGEHIELRQELAQEPAYLRADPGMVEQVLVNLCVNARDAMPDGGTLTLRTQAVSLDEAQCRAADLPRPGRYVRLDVADTGSGMSADVLAHIFEPFFTTKPEGQGTGLGLATVYGIVRQHGGGIQVQSAEDEGTTFSVLLPASDAGCDQKADDDSAPVARGDETLLVVEDEDHVLGLLVDLLRSQGYRVLSARDGTEALRVFEDHRDEIALILLDVVMPKAGGGEVVCAVRESSPDVRILLSTGYMARSVDVRFIREHGLSVIEKPYSPYELFRKVRELLDAPGQTEKD